MYVVVALAYGCLDGVYLYRKASHAYNHERRWIEENGCTSENERRHLREEGTECIVLDEDVLD